MEDRYVFETINKYFTRLSQVGYIPDKDIYSILLLCYINELQDLTLTNEEQAVIDKALSCIQGSCLIPFKSCNRTCNK